MHTNVLAKNGKLHKFAITNSNFEKKMISDMLIPIDTCISIFNKIGLVYQSTSCTQIYLQNNRQFHKFENTGINSNLEDNRLFQTCIIV